MNGAGHLQDFVNSTGKFNPAVVQTLKPVTPDGVLYVSTDHLSLLLTPCYISLDIPINDQASNCVI
jgi:hypothetical protein